jgi:hypothetical protein
MNRGTMGPSEQIVAEIGKVYRIKRSSGSEGLLFTLDAFHEPY